MFKERKALVNHTELQLMLTFAAEVVAVVQGSFYSYKTARTCSEPCSVERRLSFAVDNDSFRKLEAPTSLENHF